MTGPLRAASACAAPAPSARPPHSAYSAARPGSHAPASRSPTRFRPARTARCGPPAGPCAPRPPLRLALLGDSIAAGLGADGPEGTLAGQLAMRLSAATRRPVRIDNLAFVGARSRDLRAQLAELDGVPDVAVIVVGANDVTHGVRVGESVRHLSFAAHRLRLLGADVVVGTVPDLGLVKPIAEPLRTVAQRLGRVLAVAQDVVVRRAGGVAVPLGTLLAGRFAAEPTLFSADRFHPSSAGYSAAADALLPAVLGAVRIRAADAAERAARPSRRALRVGRRAHPARELTSIRMSLATPARAASRCTAAPVRGSPPSSARVGWSG